MKLTHRTLAVLCAAVTLPAQAGDFTSLLYGTGPGTDLKWGTADDTNAVGAGPDRILGTADDTTAKVSGAGNVLGDKLYLKVPDARAATATTPAYKPILYSSGNSKVPLAIDYFATEWRSQAGVPARGTHTAQGTLTLVDSHVTFGASLGGVAIGDVYDFVFRDSRDNTLVFGTRVELGQKPTYDQDAELNFLYRYGFVEGSTVFKTDIAWTFLGNTDLRLYNAARADLRSLIGTPTLNLNAVSFQSDINLSEGNPFSGLYLIKTDATAYKTMAGAIGYFQAGEEGQALLYNTIAGFAPTVPPPVVVPNLPVPEPSEYALFLAGLGLIGVVARRRLRA